MKKGNRMKVFLLRRRYLVIGLGLLLAAVMFLAVSLPELLSAGEPEPSEPVVQMEVPRRRGRPPRGRRLEDSRESEKSVSPVQGRDALFAVPERRRYTIGGSMIMRTSAELKQFLYGQGAGLVGIGNMEGIENCRFQTGVAIAVPLPPRAVAALREAPTLEYLDLYHALNQKLDEIVLAGERFLQNARTRAGAPPSPTRPWPPGPDLAGSERAACL